MKKSFFLIFIAVISYHDLFATHIVGGEMRYEYVGTGGAANSKQYRIKLLLLRGQTGASFITQYIVGVFNNDNNSKVNGPDENENWAAVEDFSSPLSVPILISPCIQFPPNLIYTYKTYSFLITLPNNNTGYTVAFQTFSRQNSNNVDDNQGANYLCVIPGLNDLPLPRIDNSPQFKLPISVVCANSNFSLDFSATDADAGDSLSYAFCVAYDGGLATFADFRNPAPPPYQSVNYTFPFNAFNPLGPQASINPATGFITGIAPGAGRYVLCVCITVFRNGVPFATHRKDLIVEVSGCIPTQATAMPSFTTCNGFNIQFDHTSLGALSVFWDFGDPSTLADTSTLDNPVYVYSDTGVYNVRLIINKGGDCSDSTTMTVGVFPGFMPGFAVLPPFCVGQPIRFDDTTRTSYGTVNNWSWNFGDPTTAADTSHAQNPIYTYNAPGTYTVKLESGNSKGCKDTSSRVINVIPSPVLTLFPRDTTYCGRDSLRLTATGTGTFSWTPNTFITGANTAAPFVFPTSQTKYFVTLDNLGCRTRDSVRVTPSLDLTNSIVASPANICEGDTLTLTGSSNRVNVTWLWSPFTRLVAPGSQTTRAFPISNTTYTLTTRWGNNCIATATKAVNVTPLALSNAGPDTSYCAGQPGVMLNASGGISYQWTPAAGLSNPNIPNPVASPLATTTYIVSVGVMGCSRRKPDTVVVTVRPRPILQMPGDTLICAIDTLQLTAGGTGNFVWTPATNISSTNIPNPLVSPDLPTTYYVRLTDAFNCVTNDSVFIDVKPDVTVDAGRDTTICATERFQLNTTGDGLNYSWSPSTGLSNPNTKNPIATPTVTTLYTVTANIGKCQRTSDINITVTPIPNANAGLDSTVCIGFNAQLNASGGSIYSWTPTTYLSNPAIADPEVIQPRQSILYVVTVSDTLGCARMIKDSVLIRVIPKINVDAGPSDTSVVEGQTLALLATGAPTFLWTPGTWLNDPTIPNPVFTPGDNITYTVTGTDAAGCLGTDTIRVTVYELDPDMYVPTAFTPNGDGINDIFKPILLGMRKLNYFKIFNRYGELVYETRETGKGWNGIYKGKPQDMATFVWVAEGITFKNETRQKKGNVILIR